MRVLVLFTVVLLQLACSTTVKGPITKRSYDVRVGCTSDMKRYAEERQEVVGDQQAETPEPMPFECPPETTDTPATP